jgi:hypothetical protein
VKHVAHDSDIGRRRRERAVDALERIDGVVAATVQLGAGTRVDLVRLAASPDAKHEYIRERALVILRELGFEVDNSAIVVAALSALKPDLDPAPTAAPTRTPAPPAAAQARQPDPDDIDVSAESFVDAPAPPPAWHGRFLVLDGVDVRRSDARVTCTVRLKRLGDSFSAEVQELDTPQGRARAAARAALLAAEKSGEGVGLSLEGVVLQEFFGRQYVLAFVDGIAHRRFASLSGILAVEQSLETAAALAILRAVERWVAW